MSTNAQAPKDVRKCIACGALTIAMCPNCGLPLCSRGVCTEVHEQCLSGVAKRR